MGFATDGNTDDWHTDDVEATIRRPISVAALLEREGFEPVRRRAARRALSGVAAGAVLTLGAVVGSLFLGHGRTTSGDTLAAGDFAKSGGDIILAETTPHDQQAKQHAEQRSATPHPSTPRSGPTQQAAPAPAAGTSPTVRRPIATPHKSDRSAATGDDGGSPVAGGAAMAPATTPSSSESAPLSTQSAPSTSTPPAGSGTSSTTTTAPPTDTGTGTPPSTDPSTSPTDPSTTTSPTATSPQRPGLLGGVTDALGDVARPVFSWFG